ncbi:MAG TPA: UbiA family prenyltransferase [Candidatus Moranbacteria bacterium]|nr:UbiA family prenyltransferase [Candidatus Moranbacteria bacterium]HRY27588.1 UbiA family prenyltransferase [Candidatus Moranbacteria bacterium]HSA07817.1 UbiA family prenyltransferase [Candidatus Moranbacteria bacterium]
MSIAENVLPQEEKERFSLIKIILALFGIITIRIFLDNLIYPTTDGYFLPMERFIQEPLYFFSVFFSFSLLMRFFTKESFRSIFSFLIKIFLFVLLIPLLDLALSGKVPDATQYLHIEANNFFTTFIQVINPFYGQGITIGQHIGSFFIFASIAWFIYKKTSSVFRGLISAFFSYIILFLYAILPSIITFFSIKPTSIDPVVHYNTAQAPALETYYFILKQSWLMHMAKSSGTLIFNIDILHEILMSYVFWILIVVQAIIILFISSRHLWKVLMGNFPILRAAYWFFISATGIGLSYKLFGDLNLQNPANFLALVVFFILCAINLWFAVFINDAEDIEIDKVSNPERPIVKKEISEQELKVTQTCLLLLIVFGTLTMNRAAGFLLIVAQGVYYIYSARPLRLKRHFLFSSILIGIASVSVAMASFFLVSPDQHVSTFPIKAILIIGIAYALLSNLKDIKDYEGDKKENMRTLPVVFGLEKSKYIIAALCSLVLIVVPLILELRSMLFVSIFASLFLFFLFIRKNYQEKYIFLVIFVYIITLFLMII